MTRPYPMTLDERIARFWTHVEKTDSCWNWIACIGKKGYGQFWNGSKVVKAHRFAYELLTGKIPDGKQLDHLCRNRKCVNPAHLEVVTSRENTLRGETLAAKESKQRLCKNGHPFDYMRKDGRRGCSICKKNLESKWRLENGDYHREQARIYYYNNRERILEQLRSKSKKSRSLTETKPA